MRTEIVRRKESGRIWKRVVKDSRDQKKGQKKRIPYDFVFFSYTKYEHIKYINL